MSGRAKLLAVAFDTGEAWLSWFCDAAASELGLSPDARVLLGLRQRGLSIGAIAPILGLAHRTTERISLDVLSRTRAVGCTTIAGVVLRAVDRAEVRPRRIWIDEVDARRADAWRIALRDLGGAAIEVAERDAADVAIRCPWTIVGDRRAATSYAARDPVVVLSSCDPTGRAALVGHPRLVFADPDHDDLALVLALALLRQRTLARSRASRARVASSDVASDGWPLPAYWLRRAILARLALASVTRCGCELVDTWIDEGAHKSVAGRLHLSVDATESRARVVCAALGIRSLSSLAQGVGATLDDSTTRRPDDSATRRLDDSTTRRLASCRPSKPRIALFTPRARRTPGAHTLVHPQTRRSRPTSPQFSGVKTVKSSTSVIATSR